MEDINKRFSTFYEHLKKQGTVKNASDFAKILDVSSSMITEFSKGRSSIGTSIIQKSVNKLNLNSDWLFTGKGDILKVSHKEVGTLSNKISQKVSQNISQSTLNLVNLEPSKNLIHIPITDISVAAGDGAFNNDTIEIMDTIQLPKSLLKSGTYLCVRVKGNSMSPTMHDGGYAVIRLIDKGKWIEAKDEQVYVISNMDGNAYIKRLKMRLNQGFVVCMSDNPDKNAYSNFNLLVDEINTIWHVEWYFTAKLPNIHSTYYSKVTDLEDEMWEVQQQLNQILNRLS